MPYTLLGSVLPFLSLTGVPARMSVIVVLAAAILSAFALRELFAQFPQRRLITFGLLAVVMFEMLPAPMPTTAAVVPDYVTALARLPNEGGVLNLVKTRAGSLLYYQTIHGKPIAFGYVARIPASVAAQDDELSATVVANDYANLWGVYRMRYIVTSDVLTVRADQPYMTLELLYAREGVKIYRLGCTCENGK